MTKISFANVRIILFYLTQALFLFFFKSTIDQAENYLPFLGIAFFLSIGVIILFNYLFTNNDKNIFTIVNSKIVIICLLIAPIFYSVFALDNIVSYINYVYLIDNSRLLIMISFLFLVFCLIKNDIKVFFRCSTLVFYFYLFLESIIALLLIFYSDLNNVLPLTIDLKSSIAESYMYIIFLTMPILFLLFLSKSDCKDDKKLRKKAFFSYALVALFIFLKSFILIACSGYQTLELYNYPDVVIFKNIQMFSFLERIEWLLCFNNITDSFFLIGTALFYVKEGLNHLYPLSKEKSYIHPLCISIFILLLTSFFKININWFIVVSIFFSFLNLFLSLILFWKKHTK